MSTEKKMELIIKKFEAKEREQRQFENDLSERAKKLPKFNRLNRMSREQQMNQIIASYQNRMVAA